MSRAVSGDCVEEYLNRIVSVARLDPTIVGNFLSRSDPRTSAQTAMTIREFVKNVFVREQSINEGYLFAVARALKFHKREQLDSKRANESCMPAGSGTSAA